MVMATAVPSKSTGRFVVERVGAFIKELGIDHLDIVAKSDQEPSLKKLVEDVGSIAVEVQEDGSQSFLQWKALLRTASLNVEYNRFKARSEYSKTRSKTGGREKYLQSNVSCH